MRGFYILLVSAVAGWAQSGLEVTVQKPHAGTSAGSTGLVTLSYYAPSWNRLSGFSEFGIAGMPELGYSDGKTLDHRRTASLVGLHGGHLFLLRGGILRAGFSLGSVWEEEVSPVWGITDSKEKLQIGSSRDSKLSPYFAAKLQVLLFSFIFSSHGAGFGLNFTL